MYVLFTDYGTEGQDEFIYRAAYEDPDPEHRLFYVGTTRAKERLFYNATIIRVSLHNRRTNSMTK
jgi:superfamily I DNA/RNA helicase